MMRRAALSSLTRVFSRRSVFTAGQHAISRPAWFSTELEKPIIPGIGKGKTSTGIVGLPVEPDWYNQILKHFQALLDKMEASDMPETAQFRIEVTKWCNYVIKTTKENPDNPEAVEDAVRMGQVEELIDMAKDEMIALDVYLQYRMWELVGPVEVHFNPDPMKDPVGEGASPEVIQKVEEGMEALKKKHQK